MSRQPVHEFTLGASSPADPEGPEGPEGPGGSSGSGPGRRRRSSPGWRFSPWSAVIAAAVLVVVGAGLSPQGGPWDARPPAALWATSVEPGRSPGVWLLGERLVVAEADGLTALDHDTSEQVWRVPLDDPACTVGGNTLTCVAGQGEDASVVTVDASGGTTEQRFPRADVAAPIGSDLVVAGGTVAEQPWLVRIPAGADDPVWRHEPEFWSGTGLRFTGITVGYGVVTVATAPVEREGGPTLRHAFAADAASGDARPAVVVSMGVTTFSDRDMDSAAYPLLPLSGEELVVDGYPHVAYAPVGLVDLETHTLLSERPGLPLYSLGEDVITLGWQPWTGETQAPDLWLERAHALTGEQRWRQPIGGLYGCPCARTTGNVVLTEAVFDREFVTQQPVALLGVDLRTGQHRWAQPLDAPPTGLAADADQVYLLAGGTLTAYADR